MLGGGVRKRDTIGDLKSVVLGCWGFACFSMDQWTGMAFWLLMLAWLGSFLCFLFAVCLALPCLDQLPPVGCRLEAGAKETISIYLPFAC